MPPSPRHVVISGASTGIGFACAIDLAAAGMVVHAGVRREEDARRLSDAAAARSVGDRVRPVLLDVTSERSITQARDAITAQLPGGGLYALINNAGVVVAGPLEALTSDELRQQMEINLIGAAALTRVMLPALRAEAKGRASRARIVMMSSIAGRSSLPFAWPYAASKHALEALADGLRVELRPQGVDTILIEPGAIATPIWRKSIAAGEAKAGQWPAELRGLYERRYRAFAELASRAGERGITVEHVCRAVHLALGSRRPQARYVVGRDAWARIWLGRVLPTRWIDWAVDLALTSRERREARELAAPKSNRTRGESAR